MSAIFPAIQPEAENANLSDLPLCREIAWDFNQNVPVFSGGAPVEVTGLEAVKVWCWKALHTDRFKHLIYTWDYGCEIGSLIGQTCTDDVKRSEAVRYIQEALKPNPYVKDVHQTEVSFSGDRLQISCGITTIYGEVTINV